MNKISPLIFFTMMSLAATAQNGFSFVEKKQQHQVDVMYNHRLLTAYCYYDSIRKPVLFPVNTVDGITVTRGYPVKPATGERTDHPHHTGIWFNYESVNGLDFWNNSTAIAPEKRNEYGTIKHQRIISKTTNGNTATLVAASSWMQADGKILLDELTRFAFIVKGNDFIIDRIATLKARDTTVVFKDVKDGMIAIRVARELEMPSKDKTSYIDAKGNISNLPASGNDVTGMYTASNGLQGDSVWGSKGNWVMLSGKKDGQAITIALIDHPQNIGYPSYWHARGYGLFAANPLGRKIFSNGQEALNFSLAPGQSATFRYRFVIHAGPALTRAQMIQLADEFEKAR